MTPAHQLAFDTLGRDSGQVQVGVYRYLLWRSWGLGNRVLFILLNPSTAGEVSNDPTVRRLIGFARAWGFHGFELCNAFALRSTDPAALYDHPDPIGPINDAVILQAAKRCTKVVCAWGNHGALHRRGISVAASLLVAGVELWCLKLTKELQPVHPLRQRKDRELEPLTLERMAP